MTPTKIIRLTNDRTGTTCTISTEYPANQPAISPERERQLEREMLHDAYCLIFDQYHQINTGPYCECIDTMTDDPDMPCRTCNRHPAPKGLKP